MFKDINSRILLLNEVIFDRDSTKIIRFSSDFPEDFHETLFLVSLVTNFSLLQ
jgi:hypothetical protein